MRETHNIFMAGSNLRRSRIFTNSRLILTFLIIALFGRVLGSVWEAQLRFCVPYRFREKQISRFRLKENGAFLHNLI